MREGNSSVRPLRRGNGLRVAGRRWGWVTLTLIAVNVAMFVVTAVSAAVSGYSPANNSMSPIFSALSHWPYGVNVLGQWWRVFTAAFLHYGLVHLALNMFSLLLFGSELERRLGRWRYVAVYLLSAVGGATAIQLFDDPRVAAAGASGAIFGLFGALGVLMLTQRQDMRGLIGLLVFNLLFSLLPGISLLGHLGGLVTGALAAGVLVLTRRNRPLQIAALTSLAVLLLAVTLTVPTIAVLGF